MRSDVTAAVVWTLPATRTDPDLSLIRAMAEGDTEALAELYQRHGRAVFSFVLGHVLNRQLAEEVTQDVMLAAWHAAASFRAESKVRTWLLVIARNRALNANRRRRRAHDLHGVDTVDPAQSLEPVAEQIELDAALRELPPHQRETLELVLFHGLSVAETAAVLGVAPGTEKSRLHRARLGLQAMLTRERSFDV